MRPLRSSTIVVVAALGLGCGLEVVAFLSSPVVPSPTDGIVPEYQFEQNADTDPLIFQGFELFYKFYTPDPDTYRSAYEEDMTAVTGQFTSSPDRVLRSRGYARVVNPERDDPGNPQLPLLEVPTEYRDDMFDVNVVFPGDGVTPAPGTATLQFDDDTLIVPLYRSIRGTTTEFASFSPNEVQSSDADVPNTIADTTNIALGLVVIAFGRDRSTFPAPPLYSEPVPLGIAPLLN